MSNAIPRLISVKKVMEITSLCRTSIYTIADFPEPIKINGANSASQGGARWVESEVIGWVKGRIATRNNKMVDALRGV